MCLGTSHEHPITTVTSLLTPQTLHNSFNLEMNSGQTSCSKDTKKNCYFDDNTRNTRSVSGTQLKMYSDEVGFRKVERASSFNRIVFQSFIHQINHSEVGQPRGCLAWIVPIYWVFLSFSVAKPFTSCAYTISITIKAIGFSVEAGKVRVSAYHSDTSKGWELKISTG